MSDSSTTLYRKVPLRAYEQYITLAWQLSTLRISGEPWDDNIETRILDEMDVAWEEMDSIERLLAKKMLQHL